MKPVSGWAVERLSGWLLVQAVIGAVFLTAQPLNRLSAQSRHTITHEDIFLMKRVGSPVLSPDGRWVVFSVTEPSYTPAEQSSDLWIVASDGSSQPRRLTATRAGEGGVAWSPDSRRIAFTAQREGDDASQVYLLNVAEGGEAQRLTNVITGASTPRWRPDGGAILFTSMIYPGAATDSANRAAATERRNRRWTARVYDASPTRLWDRWLDDRKPSLLVQTLEPGARPRDLLAGSRLVAMPGFGGQLGNAGDEIAAAWTPDGSAVVFAATTNRHEWARAEVQTILWRVPTAGGEPARLTTPGAANFNQVQFSPDGRWLYARGEPVNDRTFNNQRVVRFTWPVPSPDEGTVIAGGARHSVGAWQISPDGRTIYFTAEQHGFGKLFRAPTTGGETREVGAATAGTIGSLQVEGLPAAPVLVATWGSAVSPDEIHRIDATTGRSTALTHFNAERVAAISWQPLREFWFTASNGKRIHNFIALPPDFDSTRSYPLFVLIHGGAANMWTDAISLRWNYHLLGAPGYVMLMTDYTGSTGYTEEFSQQIQFDPLAGPAREINEAADEAIRRFRFIDATRQVAGGASYGGHLANWLAVSTTRYRALISHAGLWDLETQWATSDYNWDRERNVGSPPWDTTSLWRTQSPMRHAANLRTPVLVSVGERDFRVPMNNALEFWTALQRQNVPSRLIVWPTENHWILNGENSRYFYREVHGWIARWLQTPAAVGGGQ